MSNEVTQSKATIDWLARVSVTAENWFDLDESEQLPSDLLPKQTTLLNMFQICFGPEIRKRKASGKIGVDFHLYMAQLLQPPDGTPIIRLNDEVRGQAQLRLARPVEAGEPVLTSDLSAIQRFDLPNDELNCGHFTCIWSGGWLLVFDFRNWRQRASSTLDRATEFYATAMQALKSEHYSAATENFFTTCELISKVHLMTSYHKVGQSKTHSSVHSAINKWHKLGNVQADFIRLFNRLSSERPGARYDVDATFLPLSEHDLEVVDSELARLREGLALPDDVWDRPLAEKLEPAPLDL